MAKDARISTGLPNHPKTKKLIRKLGHGGAWNLVCLFLWAAGNRSDGDLADMSVEDIEIAADWSGEEGQFVTALLAVRFLDGEDGMYAIHDWEEHNPYAAGSAQRSTRSKHAALCRRYGRAHADREMPEYAEQLRLAIMPRDGSTPPAENGEEVPASGMPVAQKIGANGTPTAPTCDAPLPLPLPLPLPNTPLPPKGEGRRPRADPNAEPVGFAQWYALYQRKDAKADAMKAWRQLNPDEALQATLAEALRRWAWNPDKTKIPLPASWLRGRRWEDEAVAGAVSARPADGSQPWYEKAGFPTEYDAQNQRCYEHNAHEFQAGQRVEVTA